MWVVCSSPDGYKFWHDCPPWQGTLSNFLIRGRRCKCWSCPLKIILLQWFRRYNLTVTFMTSNGGWGGRPPHYLALGLRTCLASRSHCACSTCSRTTWFLNVHVSKLLISSTFFIVSQQHVLACIHQMLGLGGDTLIKIDLNRFGNHPSIPPVRSNVNWIDYFV